MLKMHYLHEVETNISFTLPCLKTFHLRNGTLDYTICEKIKTSMSLSGIIRIELILSQLQRELSQDLLERAIPPAP
jgi:hypothetical protein